MSTKINYKTKVSQFEFSSTSVELETIEDLDHAINDICEIIEKNGSGDLFAEDLCPYFGVLWPAASGLAEHLAKMGTWLKGKKVIEVGCGLALPSFIAAKNGAHVLATDFHPDVEPFLKRNQERNGLSFEYQKINWRTPPESLKGAFDFVVASDVLYENTHAKDVAAALHYFCTNRGHVLLSDPGRTYLQEFVKELEALGFRSDLFIHDAKYFTDKQVFIFSFQKR